MAKTMDKEFVTYEVALALKELGFNETCLSRYCAVTEWEKLTGEILFQNIDCNSSERFLLKAPLKQQVFRWFREKYDLHSYVFAWLRRVGWGYDIPNESSTFIQTDDNTFTTYEEAENACIDKLIEIAKQQDND
jgi:hypothetical protein